MRARSVSSVACAASIEGSIVFAIHPARRQPSAWITRALSKRVVDAAESQADDEDREKIERAHDIGLHQRIRNRREPAARALDDDDIAG